MKFNPNIEIIISKLEYQELKESASNGEREAKRQQLVLYHLFKTIREAVKTYENYQRERNSFK